jgi:hypothetical protein
MSIKLVSTGGGSVTIQEPNTASDFTLSVPAQTANILTNKTAGTVVQVVNNTIQTAGNYFTTSSTSLVSTGVSVSLTPSSSTNKVLLTVNAIVDLGANNGGIQATIFRGATNLGGSSVAVMGSYYIGVNTAGVGNGTMSMSFLDSPSTTSSTTYTIYVASSGGAATVVFGAQGRNTISFTAQEIVA